MRNHRPSRLMRGLAPVVIALLSGCQGGILDPKGQIAAEQKSLILTATALMLLVVIPVIVMTLVFAWKYRASNKEAAYEPKWSHSTKIEIVVWLIPCIIIAFLATLTWKSTHKLDPYRPLESDKKAIQVQVVALNWKWLFIYPEQQIASVNELVFPADTPVSFKITSDAAMNSFFIPQLGGQIYAMAGMQTQLHLIANEPGTYKGFSANYSGAGFSGMKFNAVATKTPAEFEAWVAKAKASGKALDAPSYLKLLKPSENNAVEYYASTTPYLFEAVQHKYMAARPSLADSDDAIKLTKMTKELCAAITPPVVKE
ncbi:ubiquinol oxidase subunit II [Chromobacterium vaccinii]|nr:cytochrome ubiquinol oxidase subunit II [Chromobacterium vaccinii]MBX9295233.1 ubiquinol oxidase subunit II [Chromobacterium vaccinii]MBX9349830.1 ubiquinol oxidase subunit II [Chromobacterium vaccinii]MBX9358928.1 ubiquinol oxidase subunit II [Chromobacterium vaccinii]NHQ82479.1 ubiquinol oxidase subunit II [Chromobacterium vaccinii]